jgi:hypothetical protein
MVDSGSELIHRADFMVEAHHSFLLSMLLLPRGSMSGKLSPRMMTDERRIMKDRLDVFEHLGVVVTYEHG